MTPARAQIDADIERIIKGLTAAVAYETQLYHAGHALAQARVGGPQSALYMLVEARQALHAAAQKAIEMQHRLPNRAKTVLAAMPGTIAHELIQLEISVHRAAGEFTPEAKDELAAIANKIQARERGVEKLRASISAELAILRARARGQPEPKRPFTAADIADAANEATHDEHAQGARETLAKLH